MMIEIEYTELLPRVGSLRSPGRRTWT